MCVYINNPVDVVMFVFGTSLFCTRISNFVRVSQNIIVITKMMCYHLECCQPITKLLFYMYSRTSQL